MRRFMMRISLPDRLLIIFLAVLFLQSAVGMFTGGGSTIDVIVRTSLASIFGYFLSGGFGDSSAAVDTGARQTDELRSSDSEQPTARIGFQTGQESARAIEMGNITSDAKAAVRGCTAAQEIIVASVGLVSLALLVLMRLIPQTPDGAEALASQLRDFVSASVGYLISCGRGTR